MHHYMLAALGTLSRSYRTAHNALVTPELKAVATAFIGNVDRAMSASAVPMRLIHTLSYFQNICFEAWKKIMQKHDFLKEKRVEITVSLEFAAECKSLIEKYIEDRKINKEGRILIGGPAPFTPPWFEMWDNMDYQVDGISAPTMFIVDAMVACSGEFLSKGTESVLSNIVVGVWTAFETLAGDLWVATLNAHPRDLDRLSGEEKRIQKAAKAHRAANAQGGALPPDKPNPRQQEGEKEIRIKDIHDITDGGYDLSARMGELLRAKVGFTTLYEIRRAYSLAFDHRKVGKKVTDAVDDALANSALDALSQVRNVIVHKAGIADADYEVHRATLPTMPQIAKGQPVQLDGLIVRDLISPVIDCCENLLTAVDQWLGRELASQKHGTDNGI